MLPELCYITHFITGYLRVNVKKGWQGDFDREHYGPVRRWAEARRIEQYRASLC